MNRNLSVEIKELESKLKSLRAKTKNPELELTRINERVFEGVRLNGRKYTVRANRDRFFFPDEWSLFFDCLKENQKFTFNFLLNTGARINEARNVRVEDIDLDNKRLILRVTKVKAKSGEKNPRPRTIPFSSQFAKYIGKYIRSSNLKNGDFIGILSTPGANIAMKTALKKAGIKDWFMFSIHNIRKTLETWLLSLNVEIGKLSRHMGHNIATAIQHYVSPDIFSWNEKEKMRFFIGDLYQDRIMAA